LRYWKYTDTFLMWFKGFFTLVCLRDCKRSTH